MHLLKLSLRAWKNAYYPQVFAVLALAFCSLSLAAGVWLDRELLPLVASLRNDQLVTVFIRPGEGMKSAQAMADSIRTSLGASARVEPGDSARFIREMALHHPDLVHQIEELGADAGSLIPQYVSIHAALSDAQLKKLSALDGVEKVETSRERYRPIVESFASIRKVVVAGEIGFAFLILLILVYVAQVNTLLQSDVASLLRLWGANPFQIRLPALLSCAWVGLIAGMIAAGAWILLSQIMVTQVRALSPMTQRLQAPSLVYPTAICLALLGAGVVAGIVQSYRSRSC